MTCTEPAYAKLNLTLDILGKRPDGYHDMRMVMQSVTLADEVSVELLPEPGLDITADLPFLPKGEGNIAGKAAAANIDEYLGFNHEIEAEVKVPTPRCTDLRPRGRVNATERDACERKGDFQCIECGMTDQEAGQESSRCLRCDHFGYGNFKGGRVEKW